MYGANYYGSGVVGQGYFIYARGLNVWLKIAKTVGAWTKISKPQ